MLRRTWVTLGMLVCSFLTARSADAEFVIIDQSATVDPANQQATFNLLFSSAPDFNTIDEFNRPATSFQYAINPDWVIGSKEFPFRNMEIIVRGDEIHVDGDLRIRDAEGDAESDPNSGGWGPIRGSVPFQLSGNALSFTTDLSLIGDDDGIFAYRVFTLESGGATSEVEVVPVPLPPSLLPAAALIAVIVFVRHKWRGVMMAPRPPIAPL